MHDVGDKVVGGPLRVLDLDVRPQEISELYPTDRKVDDGRVLFDVKSVLGEPGKYQFCVNFLFNINLCMD